MMATVTLDFPDELVPSFGRSPEDFAGELRLAAAIYWYSRGEISQERAAQVAGLDRTDFLMALAQQGVDAFGVDFADLERELTRDWSQADEDAWQREVAIARQNARKAGIDQEAIDRDAAASWRAPGLRPRRCRHKAPADSSKGST